MFVLWGGSGAGFEVWGFGPLLCFKTYMGTVDLETEAA